MDQQYENLIKTVSEEETVNTGFTEQLENLHPQTSGNECISQVKHDEKLSPCPEHKSEDQTSQCEVKGELFNDERNNEIVFEDEQEKLLKGDIVMDLDGELQTATSEREAETSDLDNLQQECETLTHTETIDTSSYNPSEDPQILTKIDETSWQAKHNELVPQNEILDSENLHLQNSLEKEEKDLEAKADHCEKVSEEQLNSDIVIGLEKQLQTGKSEMEIHTSDSGLFETLTQTITEKETVITNLSAQLENLQERLSNNETQWQAKHSEVILQWEKHKSELMILQGSEEKLKHDLESKHDLLIEMERKYEKVSDELQEKQANSDIVMGLENQLKTLKGELETQTSNSKILEQQYDILAKTVAQKETVITDLNKQLEGLQIQTNSSETWQTKHDDLVNQYEKSKDENLLLQESLENLKKDLEAKDNVLLAAEGKCMKVSEGLQESEKLLQTVTTELETKISSFETFEQQCEILAKTVTEKEAMITDFNKQLGELQTQMNNKDTVWQAKYDELVLQNEKFKSENLLLQESSVKMKNDFDSKDSLLFDAERKFEKASEELQESERHIQSLKGELESQTSNLNHVEQQCNTLTQTVTKKETAINDLKSQLEDLHAHTSNNETQWQIKYDEMVVQADKHKSDFLLLQENHEKLENDLKAKDSLLVEMERKYENVSEELHEKQVNCTDVMALENQLQKVKSEFETQSSTFVDTQLQYEKLTNTLADKEAVIVDLTKQLGDLEKQTNNTEMVWQTKHNEIVLLCEKHKSENLLLQESLEKQTNDVKAKEDLLVEMERKYEEVSEQFQDKCRELIISLSEKQSNHEVVMDLEQQLQTLKDKMTSQTSTFNELESKWRVLNDDYSSKQNEISAINSLLTETKMKCEQLTQQLKDKDAEYNATLEMKTSVHSDLETKYKEQSKELQDKSYELIISLTEKQFNCDLVLDLEKQVQHLKCEFESKTSSLSVLESQLMALKEENLDQKRELSTMKLLLSEMENARDQIAQELQDKETEIHAAASDKKSRDDKISEMQNEIHLLTTDLQTKSSTIEEMEKANNVLKDTLLAQSKENEEQYEKDQVMKENELLKKAEAEKKMDELKKEMMDSKADLEAEKNKCGELKNEINDLKISNDELNSAIASYQSDSECKKQEISNLEKQCIDFNEQLSVCKMKCSSLEDEVVSCKAELSANQNLTKSHLTDLEEMKIVFEQKKEMLEQGENKLNLLQQELTRKDEEILQNKSKIQDMEEKLQCNELANIHEQEQEESKAILESKLERAQEALDKCQQRITQIGSDNDRLQSSIETVTAEKNHATTQFMAVLSEINDLRSAIELVKRNNEIIQEELSRNDEGIPVAGDETEEYDTHVESITNCEGKGKDLKDVCDGVMDEDEPQVQDMEKASVLEGNHEDVLYLKKEIADLSNQLKQLGTNIASHKSNFISEIANLKSSLEIITSDRDSLETAAKEIEQQNSDLKKEIEKTDEKCKELQTAVSDYELKFSNLTSSISSKEKEILDLETQLREVQAQVLQMSSAVEKKDVQEIKSPDIEQQVENQHIVMKEKTDVEDAESKTVHLIDDNGNGDNVLHQESDHEEKCHHLELDSTHHLKEELEYFRKENEALKKERLEQNLNEECLKAELAGMRGDTSKLYNESFSTQKFEDNEQFWNLIVEKESLQKELDQAKTDLEAVKSKLETEMVVEREVANLKEKLAQSHFDISELQCQLDHLESEKSAIEQDLNAAKQENGNLIATFQDIQDGNKDLEDRLQGLITNESHLNKEAIESSAELSDMQVQYEKLHNILAKSGSQTSEGNAKKVQIVPKNTKKLSKSESKIRLDLTNDLKNMSSEREILKEKVAGLEKELSETRKVLEERNQSMEVDQDNKAMETLLDQGDGIDLKCQIHEIQNEKLNIETEKNSLLQKNKELFEENQQVQEQNKVLELKIEEFSCAAQDVGDDLRKLHDVIKDQNESLARKKREIVVKANEIDTLRTDLAELFTRIQGKQKEIDSLTEEVSQLKRELKESKANAGTLEDVVEALNLDMATLEDEKSSLTSSLENAEAKIKELQNDLQVVQQSIEKTVRDNDKTAVSELLELKDKVKDLKNENKELSLKVNQMKEREIDLRKDIKISQEALEKKCMECEDLILQIAESKSESAESFEKVTILQDKLSSTKSQLSELQFEIKEKNEKMSVLLEEKGKTTIALEGKDEEITNLMRIKADLSDQMESKQEELMLVCDEKEILAQQFAEETKKCEVLMSSNESLLCQLGEKEDGLSSVIKKYKDSSESLECIKASLTSRLNEKQDEISQLLQSQQDTQNQISKMEKCVSELEKEIQNKDDEIQKLSTNLSLICDELQQSKSSKDETNIKVQKLEKDLLDKDARLKQVKEEHKTMLAQVIEAAEKLEREKDELSMKLLESQGQSSSSGKETGKEVLKKWEQRCKELDSNLTMERRKCQGLTDQINALKSAETGGSNSHKEIEELKSELVEVKKDRDCMRDERQQIYLKAKEHKDKADLLTCRIRFLTHMLKKQGKGNGQAAAPENKADNKCIENENPVPRVPSVAETDVKQCHSETESISKSLSKVTSAVPSSSSDSKHFSTEKQANEDKGKSESVEVSTGFEKGVKNTEVTNVLSSPSIQRKELTSPPNKKLSPLSLRKRTSKLSPVSTFQVSAEKKEDEIVQTTSELKVQPLPASKEVPPSPPTAHVTRISTRKRNSSQSSQSSVSKEDLHHGDEKADQLSEQSEPVTRVTRRSTLRKRQSTESLPSAADGKKSKVIYEDPLTWLEGPPKQAKGESSVAALKRSKPSTTCDLTGPATRSKAKETSSKVLNPITNSPVKEGQHRPKGFLRQTNRMSERKMQTGQGKDEAAQNCNTQ